MFEETSPGRAHRTSTSAPFRQHEAIKSSALKQHTKLLEDGHHGNQVIWQEVRESEVNRGISKRMPD
jgi:hypothetical protein